MIRRLPPRAGEDVQNVQQMETDTLVEVISEEILACFTPGSYEHTLLAEALRRLLNPSRP